MPFDPVGFQTNPADELDGILRRWAAELRSGRHRQCADRFNGENGTHCALGVVFNNSKEVFASNLDLDWLITITRANDSGKTFPEIADMIDAYADARQS